MAGFPPKALQLQVKPRSKHAKPISPPGKTTRCSLALGPQYLLSHLAEQPPWEPGERFLGEVPWLLVRGSLGSPH